MKTATRKINILYCSQFKSFRTHRQLVRMASEHSAQVTAVHWGESEEGRYTGPLPIDGVISHINQNKTARLIQSAGSLPHVTMNSETADALKLPSAVADHVKAGRMVADHFLALGFVHFAAFVDSERYDAFNRRLKGFSQAIADAGCLPPIIKNLKDIGNDLRAISNQFRDALKDMPIPLAIMAANDRTAVKLMYACQLADLTVPLQVAVCGFDNDPITCEVAPIPLSSVDINPEQQATAAFTMLHKMLCGKKPVPRHAIIEPKELVVRRSSGLQANADGTVSKALAYIHEQAWNKNLNIPTIAAHSGVSKSTLFHLFGKSLSVTPLQYITQLRVDRAMELMRETGQNINEVRPLCGFATDYQMYRAFKRTTGESPRCFK